jgi:hypothetical protein
MANNRIWLLCNVCCPEFKNVPPLLNGNKVGFCLGKWYPGHTEHGGYGPIYTDGINDFFDAHSHNNIEYPVRLEYESPQDLTK